MASQHPLRPMPTGLSVHRRRLPSPKESMLRTWEAWEAPCRECARTEGEGVFVCWDVSGPRGGVALAVGKTPHQQLLAHDPALHCSAHEGAQADA